MNKIKKYIKEHEKKFLNELFQLIKIPSISAGSGHKQDLIKAAELWREILLNCGVDQSVILGTKGNPVVYGEKIINKDKQTILVYGHYDVMPVDPVDEWKSPPFEPEIRDNKIYARGADDDKGQAFIQAKAFEYLVKYNLLNCNVKFLIEGEEEIGSPSLEKFCSDNRELLKSDVILVSDTSMFAPEIPSITTGLRGLSYIEVEVKGPDVDLHSGAYGGGVPNPANILAKMIASLKDDNHVIQIPGFYDDVIKLDRNERVEINKAPFNIEEYKKAIGINDIEGEAGYTTIERVGIRPSLDVNGIWGGYTGEGAKTIIPSKATAKISMRLVPNQNHEKITALIKKHLFKIAPPSAKLNIKVLHGGQSYISPLDNKAYIAAGKAINKVFGKFPIPERSGGSIPIISTFEKVLGTKSILLGFGLESDAIHSPNENFPLDQFFKGIETVVWFYKYFCE